MGDSRAGRREFLWKSSLHRNTCNGNINGKENTRKQLVTQLWSFTMQFCIWNPYPKGRDIFYLLEFEFHCFNLNFHLISLLHESYIYQ